MATRQQNKAREDEQEDVPSVIPAERAQVVPVGTMDRDPATGAEIRFGDPETSDEEELADFLLWLQEKANENNEDSMARLADILRRSKTAETVAEALKEKHTVNGKDFIGIGFMALGFEIHEGKFEDEEIPFFVSIRATNANHPDEFIVNCGGEKILPHIRTLDRLNAFPIPLRITGKETRKKRLILSFEVLEQTKG